MSKQIEKSILGLLVAGAMLITLGAGVVVAETHPHIIDNSLSLKWLASDWVPESTHDLANPADATVGEKAFADTAGVPSWKVSAPATNSGGEEIHPTEPDIYADDASVQ